MNSSDDSYKKKENVKKIETKIDKFIADALAKTRTKRKLQDHLVDLEDRLEVEKGR